MSSRGESDSERRGDLDLFIHSRTCRDSDLIRESKTKESSYYLDSRVEPENDIKRKKLTRPRMTERISLDCHGDFIASLLTLRSVDRGSYFCLIDF